MNFLKIFETLLAQSADEAMQHPTGGLAGFLVKNPSVAVVYVTAVTAAHDYLSKLEGPPSPS